MGAMRSHKQCSNFPGTRILWIRKYKESLKGSIVQTMNKILPFDPIEKGHDVFLEGGSKPTGYKYKNGSYIALGGINHVESYLSAEFAAIYVNQAEELTLEDWSMLKMRATERGAHPDYPYTYIYGDCNPSDANHWIINSDDLTYFNITHEMNPTIMIDGEYVSDQARRRVEILDTLPPLLKARYRDGLWKSAEDAVYQEFIKEKHVAPMELEDIPRGWRWGGAIDYGLRDASVYWLFAFSPNRDAVKFFSEIYQTGLNANKFAEKIHEVHKFYNVRPEFIVADHDSNSNDILIESGLRQLETTKKSGIDQGKHAGIESGISNVKDWLSADIGTLTINEFSLFRNEVDQILDKKRHPTSTVAELGVYSYYPIEEQKLRKHPDLPIDKFNHGCDCIRYALWRLTNYKRPVRISGSGIMTG